MRSPACSPQTSRQARLASSPVLLRSPLGPRAEALRSRKQGRTSNLFNDYNGLLNSQLGETQWAINMGLAETQTQSPFSPGTLKLEEIDSDDQEPGLPRNWKSLYIFSPSPDRKRLEHFKLYAPKDEPLSGSRTVNLDEDSKLHIVKAEPLSDSCTANLDSKPLSSSRNAHLNENSELEVKPLPLSPTANSDKVKDEGTMELTHIEREIIYQVRNAVRSEWVQATDAIDLIRMELDNRERYIGILEATLVEAGIPLPQECPVESQQVY
ncbi:hypothetical protein K435DRAFT_785810 [Dendrothele bispora CBS 962.96]|uniref:Uncharacterized protein n=1 Tax=Dendrothele bispora (strain CBS 962.96) TaxID=1314807 RepID=A0A4S8KUE7_DENBC|nr:hypothetical protein K435DRAFT_785810 [Dendrothele bispora CBS 962.96]